MCGGFGDDKDDNFDEGDSKIPRGDRGGLKNAGGGHSRREAR